MKAATEHVSEKCQVIKKGKVLYHSRYSTGKEIQKFVYNGRNLSPIWSRMNAVWYLWWTTHKPATVSSVYDPAKENPTTLTIVVTFALKILF